MKIAQEMAFGAISHFWANFRISGGGRNKYFSICSLFGPEAQNPPSLTPATATDPIPNQKPL